MSIPKEPRQLMINIMYLVLTALLALNVSAEVFNAFKLVDKGLVKSNISLDEANSNMPKLIKDGAKKRESLGVYAEKVDPIIQKSDELSQYLKDIVTKMIDESGGYVNHRETGEVTDELKGKKDYDITTRTLVEGPEGPGIGEDIKQKMLTYRSEILSMIDDADKAGFEKEIAVQIDDQTWQDKKKKSWAHMNFDHMPLQAVVPIFSKYVNDVKSTEASALNYLANKVGTTVEVTFDEYAVVSAPEKAYIINGETYKSELFLSASAGSDSKTGISIAVNGRNVPLNKEGKAVYTAKANGVGVKNYTAVATVTNPVTGDSKKYTKKFEYEVGERSVAISASKMNVFYIGVDNPVEVSAAGVPSSQVKVSMNGGGGTIKKNGDGTYTVNVTKPTSKGADAKVNVTAPGMNASKNFRVKRIPDPVPVVGSKGGGVIGSGELKGAPGVLPILKGFDFEAKCKVNGFKMIRVAPRSDAEIVVNRGGKFTSEAKAKTAKARPGDRFFFEDIKCTCPGDKAPRDIGTMSFAVR